MITVRQIERLWDAHAYDRLTAELLAMRVEDSPRLRTLLTGSLPAAALGLIRLDELSQAHNPLAQKFVRRILASQTTDGGWDDPLLTALCIRALLTSNGHGPAVDRAIAHLADIQKSDGAWPREPIRRLAADSFTTVFVMFALGAHEPFRATVRMEDAIRWVRSSRCELDATTKKLWLHASMRAGLLAPVPDPVRVPVRVASHEMLIWS